MLSIRLVGAAALMLAGTPALAITPLFGVITATGMVNQAGNGDLQDNEQLQGQFTAGFATISAAPAVYNAAAQATVANAFTTASWDRPDLGYVLLNAGWFSNNGGSGDDSYAGARAGWAYVFATGNRGARLNASWAYDVTGDPNGFLGMTIGFDRQPMLVDSAGQTSWQLAPNNIYALTVFLGGERLAPGGLDQDVTAQGLFNWSIAAVPEPESWVTMLIGFALAGASLRRRQLRQVAA